MLKELFGKLKEKLFGTKEAKIYSALIAGAIVLCGFFALFAATTSDENRLIYELKSNDTYVVKDIKNIFRGGIFFKDTLVVPSEHKGKKVVSIDRIDTLNLKYLILEEGIETIGSGAFSGTENLVKVSIPSTVKTIEAGAFSGCRNLEEVELAENSQLQKIGDKAFYNCSKLEKINCNLNEISVNLHSFKNTKLAKDSIAKNNGFFIIDDVLYDFESAETENVVINIPENIKRINQYSFYQLTNIKTVNISTSVETIGFNTFEGCTKLQEVNFPATINLKVIEKEVFENCSSLTNFVLPASVTKLEANAFSGCTGLTTFLIPLNVKEIETNVFSKCSNLVIYAEAEQKEENWSYTWNSNRPAYYGINENTYIVKDNLQYVLNLENKTATLTKYVANEESVTIPEKLTLNGQEYTVEIIGSYALSGCNEIKNVYLANSIKTVESYAFSGCTGLAAKIFAGEEANTTIQVDSANANFTSARAVFNDGTSYYTYVFLTTEDRKNNVETKLFYDLENQEIYRYNDQNVKEIFNQLTYKFTVVE